MKTFVIFDRKTGQILQTHVQSRDLHGGPEELVRTARPEAEIGAVDVMEVEGLTPGSAYRVDVKARKLVRAEGGVAGGAAGAFLQPAVGDPHMARTVVVHVERRGRP